MKTQTRSFSRRLAFTLIELLVVMAVIAVLAAMIFPAAAIVKRKAAEKRIQGLLGSVVSAIETYQANVKVYPPENPINPALAYVSAPERNTLFYELSGVQLVGGEYQPTGGRGASLMPTCAISSRLARLNSAWSISRAGVGMKPRPRRIASQESSPRNTWKSGKEYLPLVSRSWCSEFPMPVR
jgi:prepilin-type N-terminal cleavage/methylation domain-containing protein